MRTEEQKAQAKMISEKTIERLSQYRRLMTDAARDGDMHIYSHQLAEKVGGTAAQVRRDLMEAGVTGHSKRGYEIAALVERIGRTLDNPAGERVVLIGLGNLGRAILPFFAAYHPNLRIVASFDTDPMKTGRVIHGCRCHPLDELETVIRNEGARVAIVTVPAAEAQGVAERLAAAGVLGIMNFAPVSLKVPQGVFVESIDIATALEKVAYLARLAGEKEKE